MKEKEIYIHIGMPRAGSTFLQEVVFPKLDPKKIYAQPQKIKDEVIPNMVRKVWIKGYLTDEETKEFKDEFWKVINTIPNKKILISQEGLGGFDFQAGRGNLNVIMQALKVAVPEAKILVVMRNQFDWIKSLYYLAIYEGYYTSFSNFLFKTKNYWHIDLEQIEFNNIYTIICSYFDEVYAIRFELIKENFGEYINIFEKILNTEIISDLDHSPINKSLSDAQLFFIGKLGSLLGYDRIWQEKYTFIPRQFNTSLRSNAKFHIKIIYVLLNLYRFSIYSLGKLLGKVFNKKKIINIKLKNKINEQFQHSNNVFWKGKNLISNNYE